MNLFDKIKDAFSDEDEKAAAEKAAADQAAADQAAAENQAAIDSANAAAAAEAEAHERAENAQIVADQERAVQEAQAAEQAAQEQAAQQAAQDQAAAQAAADQAAQQAAQEQAAAQQAAAAKPSISLNGLLAMIQHDSSDSVVTGQAMNADAGLVVERALASVVGDTGPVDGSLGTSFTAAYARWQESLGYSGADADGIPGRASLQALAERTGAFTVAD